jgi:Chalcone isomerase-like
MTIARRPLTVALLILALGGAGALAADTVGVPGSSTRFATTTQTTLDGKPAALVLTGAALRQKFYFNVYTVASYMQEGAKAHTPEDLAAADCPKRLELVMERTVDGKEMAEAFRAAIRVNYPEPAFSAEVGDLMHFMQGQEARKFDHIVLTYVPGVGLHCELAGRAEVLIKGAQFHRAVWDIYLGKNNLGEEIKKGLASRL